MGCQSNGKGANMYHKKDATSLVRQGEAVWGLGTLRYFLCAGQKKGRCPSG